MKQYADIRESIRDGDLLSVRGESWLSRIIMLFSRRASHSAMFLWIGEGLWVWEIRESVATRALRLTPASAYVEDHADRVYPLVWSKAPQVVRDDPTLVNRALAMRHNRYGWLGLLVVVWSQIRNKPLSTRYLVCSVAIQTLWEGSGVKFNQLASPSDLKAMCTEHVELIS